MVSQKWFASSGGGRKGVTWRSLWCKCTSRSIGSTPLVSLRNNDLATTSSLPLAPKATSVANVDKPISFVSPDLLDGIGAPSNKMVNLHLVIYCTWRKEKMGFANLRTCLQILGNVGYSVNMHPDLFAQRLDGIASQQALSHTFYRVPFSCPFPYCKKSVLLGEWLLLQQTFQSAIMAQPEFASLWWNPTPK